MNAKQRAALRLDIATRILAADIAYEGLPRAIGIPDAISFADLMIRSNDEFDAMGGTGPSEVRDLIVTLAREVFVGDFTPMVIRDIARALCRAAGIPRPEIFDADPDDGEI